MEEKTNKRELILSAAQAIFIRKGYHNTTSEEIAKEAGVGKGTIYQYFESKADIFMEMHRRYVENYIDSIDAQIILEDTFEDNLRRIVRFHGEHMHDMAQYCMHFMAELPEKHLQADELQCAKQNKERLDSMLEEMITAAQQRGELRLMKPQLVLTYITGIMIGVAHQLCREAQEDTVREQVEKEVVQLIMHGIAM